MGTLRTCPYPVAFYQIQLVLTLLLHVPPSNVRKILSGQPQKMAIHATFDHGMQIQQSLKIGICNKRNIFVPPAIRRR
jgi:hypothetical protein